MEDDYDIDDLTDDMRINMFNYPQGHGGWLW
jgi:hypothetical protein